MKVDIFDFELNKNLIANQPCEPRDACKLLDLTNPDSICDRFFYELPNLLEEGDILVFNDTKVIPGRLYARRGNAEVEVTLYHPVDGIKWWAFIKNSKRLHAGDTIIFYTDEISPKTSSFTAQIIEKKADDGVCISFNCKPENLSKLLEEYGSMPLPPYIKRNKPGSDSNNIWNRYSDKENYQTIYAKYEGAVAAPTAGLHFTDKVFNDLEQKGIKKVFLTLHVGAGTFLPVKVEDTDDHKMHAEYGIITQSTCDIINEAKAAGGRLICVGTTSCRTIESVAREDGYIPAMSGDTGIFIYPGYRFKAVDALITNFHLPESTLLMLVSAFYDKSRVMEAYQVAVDEKHRFFSFGDAMFIE